MASVASERAMTEPMAPSWNTWHQQVDPHGFARAHLADWLRDAHTMELQAGKMLEAQAGRLEHYPDLCARVRQHVTETRQQACDVEQCLELLGKDTSAFKNAGGKTMAMLQAMGDMITDDEVIKGVAAGQAFEHMEVAIYTILIAAAQAAGEPGIAQSCERIRQQEQAMAAWLAEHMPAVVQKSLQRENADEDSGR